MKFQRFREMDRLKKDNVLKLIQDNDLIEFI